MFCAAHGREVSELRERVAELEGMCSEQAGELEELHGQASNNHVWLAAIQRGQPPATPSRVPRSLPPPLPPPRRPQMRSLVGVEAQAQAIADRYAEHKRAADLAQRDVAALTAERAQVRLRVRRAGRRGVSSWNGRGGGEHVMCDGDCLCIPPTRAVGRRSAAQSQ